MGNYFNVQLRGRDVVDKLECFVIGEWWRCPVEIAEYDRAQPRESFVAIHEGVVLGHRLQKRSGLETDRCVGILAESTGSGPVYRPSVVQPRKQGALEPI